MGVTQRQTQQLQPRRLREWVPGFSLLQQNQTSTFSSSTSQTPITTTVEMAVSKIRQNYHEDCEALINKQINMEFYASYVYLSMSSYFNRDDQALHGFAAHFKTESGEERARRHEADGVPDQAWRKSCLPGHRQADHHGMGNSTCTRWPETRATDTSATSSSLSTSESRLKASRPSGPDHQDEESRRRTRAAFDRQGDGILNFGNHTKPQLAAIIFTNWFGNKQFFVWNKKKK